MYIGSFVVGKDIKANYYKFTAIDEEDDFCMNVYPNTEKVWTSRTVLQAGLCNSFIVDLKDGMVIEVVRGIGFVEVIDKPDWAI